MSAPLSLGLRVAKALARGEAAIVPVDTEYQLVASARKREAVEELFSRTSWTSNKPLPTLYFANLEALNTWGLRLSDGARKLAEAFWPGPLEVMVPRPNDYDGVLCGGRDSVTTRIVKHSFIGETLKALSEIEGRSAALVGIGLHRPGGIPVTQFEHAAAALRLPSMSALLQSVAYAVGAGLCRHGIAPSLIDATRAELKLRRLGPLSLAELEAAAQEPIAMATCDEAPAADIQEPSIVPLDADELAALQLVGRAWVIARRDAPADMLAKNQWITLPDDDVAYTRELFAAVYRAAAQGATTVYVARPSDSPIGQALAGRLQHLSSRSAAREQKTFAS